MAGIQKSFKRAFTAFALLTGIALSPAGATGEMLIAGLPNASEPLFGDQVAPTVGAALMCGRELQKDPFCVGVAAYRPLKLTEAALKLIDTVNRAVNTEIEPVDDMVQWRVPEKWSRPARAADGHLQDDCDGYVIEKWYRLVREGGLSAEAFYPLYAEVPAMGGHLVLAVDTDHGTYILDNLHEALVPMQNFAFTYLKRPTPGQRLEGVWEKYLDWGRTLTSASNLSAAH